MGNSKKKKKRRKVGYESLGMLAIALVVLVLLGGLMLKSNDLQERLTGYDAKAATLEQQIEDEQNRTEEIDKLKKHNDDLLRKLRNRVKEVKKLKKYSLYKEEFSRLNQQLQSKDKIIDLMANHIATSDSYLCQYLDITTKCKYYAGENGNTCDECIKQYFERQAKNDTKCT